MHIQFDFKVLYLVAALLGGLTACASYTGKMREMRDAYAAGDYSRALESLGKSGLKDNSSDTLLWQLESAMILDRQGQFESSRKFLLEADKTVDELYTVSISKTASTFVSNESAADYEGEDYEKVAIHSILAHQFIGLGKISEAAVEARKINNKLYEINQKYDAEHRNKYGEDAHARYLSALIYESRGECDNAIIDYKKALDLYDGGFSRYIKGGLPTGLVQGLARCLLIRQRAVDLKSLIANYDSVIGHGKAANLPGQGGLVVVHELGEVAVKHAQDFFISAGKQLVRFSYPVIAPGQIYDQGTGVEIEKIGEIHGENTAYLDAIAADALEDRRGRLVAKQMARLLIKGQLNYQAEKNFGPLAGLAANVITAATETADTRSWTTLPKAFYITRAQLGPGTYKVKIKTNGKINTIKSITIKKGQLILMRGVG
jgi:hypothetical protein